MFSDGTQHLPIEDVIVSCLDQGVLRVEESTDITVAGSGTAILQVTWSPECSSSSLASTNVTVTVVLPDPIHIEITLNTTRITPSDSLADQAVIAEAASMQAVLVYPDNARIDFITDERLQLDLAQANGLITT